MRFYALLLCGLLSLGVNAASGKPLITPAEIEDALIGHMISGIENGEIYFEYFDPSGHLYGENREGRYQGRWRIKNAHMCIHYNDEAADAWDCMRVDAERARIIWIDSEGASSQSKKISGKFGGW